MGKEAEGEASVGMAVGGDVVCSGGREVTEEEQTGNVVVVLKKMNNIASSSFHPTKNMHTTRIKKLFVPSY